VTDTPPPLPVTCAQARAARPSACQVGIPQATLRCGAHREQFEHTVLNVWAGGDAYNAIAVVRGGRPQGHEQRVPDAHACADAHSRSSSPTGPLGQPTGGSARSSRRQVARQPLRTLVELSVPTNWKAGPTPCVSNSVTADPPMPCTVIGRLLKRTLMLPAPVYVPAGGPPAAAASRHQASLSADTVLQDLFALPGKSHRVWPLGVTADVRPLATVAHGVARAPQFGAPTVSLPPGPTYASPAHEQHHPRRPHAICACARSRTSRAQAGAPAAAETAGGTVRTDGVAPSTRIR